MKMANCLRRLCYSRGHPGTRSSPIAQNSQPAGNAKENTASTFAHPIAQSPDPAQNVRERVKEKAPDGEEKPEQRARLVWAERERCFRPTAEASTFDVHRCNSLLCLSCRSRSRVRFVKAAGRTPEKQRKAEAKRVGREGAADAPGPRPGPIVENISFVRAIPALGTEPARDRSGAVPFDRTESLSEDGVLHFVEGIENAGDDSRAGDARGRSDEGSLDGTGSRPDDESVLRFIESIENGTVGPREGKNEECSDLAPGE